MGHHDDPQDPESVPLTHAHTRSTITSRSSTDSGLSSAESAFLGDPIQKQTSKFGPEDGDEDEDGENRYRDLEDGSDVADPFLASSEREKSDGSSRTRRVFWILGLLCVGGWLVAFVSFATSPRWKGYSTSESGSGSGPTGVAEHASGSGSSSGDAKYGKPVPLDHVLNNKWAAKRHSLTWVAGANGEDGLYVETGQTSGKGYLRLKDVHDRKDPDSGKVLMQSAFVRVNDKVVYPMKTWPSPDLNKVLVLSDYEKNWRHSFTGMYWIFDVEEQTAEPLDPEKPGERVQLAHWSPNSDAVVFVRDNNMWLRMLSSDEVICITDDGGKDLFYGVPDWVYEEEVFGGNSAAWWSNDGKFVAYMRTNESAVPEFPVQYFLSNPTGNEVQENYPDVRRIKYPKAGAPNPTVSMQFYDLEADEVFSVDLDDDFPEDDRIINEALWASEGNLLLREANRESDIVKVFLIDTRSKTSKLTRVVDVQGLDGGWVEPARSTRFVPADPENGRPDDGYIDTVIHNGYDHLAYFAPLDSSDPVMLTSGEWEVVDAPSAVDSKNGLVYFVATKEDPGERHVYQVRLDGSDLKPLGDPSMPAYYDASFSTGAGYLLLSYLGPDTPWQAITHTETVEEYEDIIETNEDLQRMQKEYALPTLVYQNATVDGYNLPLVERRPPHFNPAKKYPVLFFLYNGPASQNVDRKFKVDFQSYVASSLGYIVVTLDGRGTGYIGRDARCAIRGNIGHYESRDQIETAKMWAAKDYVDETRMAIWGWSYGGFMTLKVLEQDAGETFQYGMAVAPVTDWRFYGTASPTSLPSSIHY